MKHLIIFITAFLLSAILISCSDLQEDITTPELPGAHAKGIINPVSPEFHGQLIRAENWSMKGCLQCHGGDYAGGIVSSSCLSCHTQPTGPEACNTCHGDFSNSSRIAPPRALNGSITSDDPGVGAHNAHLYENDLGDRVRCSTCHTFPSSFYADGHLGEDNQAEINFGRVAITGGVTPIYNFEENTCSDTYCHGNFVFYKDSSAYPGLYTADSMVGNNLTMKWTEDDDDAECGSCHGLPPTGHQPFGLNECAPCHSGVVNNSGDIIDPTKHINGVINVFGN